jgi:hypothetical protein
MIREAKELECCGGEELLLGTDFVQRNLIPPDSLNSNIWTSYG